MTNSATNCWPNASAKWGSNVSSLASSDLVSPAQNDDWNYYCPKSHWALWYDTPAETHVIDGLTVYRLRGNVWLVPIYEQPYPEYKIWPPPSEGNIIHPISTQNTGNVKPMLSVTSVKMENHPEHISVMFGQVISNLK